MDLSDFNGWLKFIHILAAITWVGGSILIQVYGSRLRSAGSDDRIRFAKDVLVAARLFAAAGIVAFAGGLWLVLRVDGWDFDQAWISIGFLGVLIGAGLGMAFYAPQTKALIGELESGDEAAEGRGRRIALVSALEVGLLIIVVWAMVFKPGL
jgi:uncharacterized membrane protein